MPAEFDIRPVVEKYSAIPTERLRILRSCEEFQLSQMQRGIVFVFAAWSGSAIIGLQRFTKVIKPFVADSLDLVVLDTDCLTEILVSQLFRIPNLRPAGGGETIWVRDGHVVAGVFAYTAPEALIEQHTKELLDDNGLH